MSTHVRSSIYWWSSIPRHTETTTCSINCNKVYLELWIKGYPLILSNVSMCSWRELWFATFKKIYFPPVPRNLGTIHKFGAFADIQCRRKLTEILSGLLTTDVEHDPVRHKFLTRAPTALKNTCQQESKSCYILNWQLMTYAKHTLFASQNGNWKITLCAWIWIANHWSPEAPESAERRTTINSFLDQFQP